MGRAKVAEVFQVQAFWVDEAFYLAGNPDVLAAGVNALEHYTLYGRFEGRSPSALFDADWYLGAYPDVAASGMDPLEHYLSFGWREGRNATPFFDTAAYLEANPDVAAAGMSPLEHYTRFGWREGRDPSPGFDTSFYLETYPDVAAAGMNPLEHYIRFGWREGRDPSPDFDTSFYLEANPDVAASGMNPLEHYLSYGAAEGRRPVPPTFDASVVDDGMVVFSGTARGDLTLTLDGTDAVFEREGVEATVPGFDGVDGLAVDGLTLNAPAAALSGIAVAGGVLVLDGIEPDTDLSRIADGVEVTVRVTADVDLSGNADVGAVDVYKVEDGATLTLSVAQAEAATIEGSYAIRDIMANLLDEGAARPVVADAPGGVTVTGAASVADLTTLAAAVAGPLTYTAVADTADNLAEGGVASVVVTPGTDVEVTDAATLAQLAAIDAANGDGALTYGAITGSAADLVADPDGYVADGIDVEVTDAATIAQLTAIDAANGDGALTYRAIADALANLVTNGVADAYIVADTDVAATGVATVDDLVAIDVANGEGALTCTALTDSWQHILSDEAQGFLAGVGVMKLTDYGLGEVTVAQVEALLALPNLQDTGGNRIELADLTFSLADTAANLASWGGSVAGIVTHATAVTATKAATVWQAEIIHGRDAAAVYDIEDGSWAIANGNSAPILAAVDLTATNLASAAEATAILARDGAQGDVNYGMQDTFVNVNGASATVRDAASDIVVTTQNFGWPPYLTTAQASAVIAYGNGGRTDIQHLRGTAIEIGSFVPAKQETAGPTGLGYDFWVQDSAAAVLSAVGDGSAGRLAFMRGNPAAELEGDHRAELVEVTGHFTVAEAETFRSAAESVFAEGTDDRTYYGINKGVVHYDNESANGSAVTGADHLRVTDTAANVHAAQNGLDAPHSQIFDLLASRASSADSIIVSGSAGNQMIRGTMGYDVIDVGDDHDTVWAGGSDDAVSGGAGFDYLQGEDGNDLMTGGTEADQLFGGNGRDTILAGDVAANTVFSDARFRGPNQVTGGVDGDNMFGSADFDTFHYQGASRSGLRAESGTTSQARDYISKLHLGDRIVFDAIDADQVQFFGSGSANAQAVEAGTVGLSVRYEKNAQVLDFNGESIVAATRVLVDVADADGRFDDVADMHIILVGADIDVNWDGYSILYGG
jgi:hypothetical protein